MWKERNDLVVFKNITPEVCEVLNFAKTRAALYADQRTTQHEKSS